MIRGNVTGRWVCRCPRMAARRSRVGWVADAPGASARSSSPGSALHLDGLSSGAVAAIVQHAGHRAGLPGIGARRLGYIAATEFSPPWRELDGDRSGAAIRPAASPPHHIAAGLKFG